MSNSERYKIAKAYVDKQLETMEKNGLKVVKMSNHEYETMVKQIAQAVSGVSKKTVSSSTSQT